VQSCQLGVAMQSNHTKQVNSCAYRHSSSSYSTHNEQRHQVYNDNDNEKKEVLNMRQSIQAVNQIRLALISIITLYK
jgi:hypothetical protein